MILTTNYPIVRAEWKLQITKTPLLDWIIWLKPRGLDRVIEATTPKNIAAYYAFVADTVTKRIEKERKREAENTPPEQKDMCKH